MASSADQDVSLAEQAGEATSSQETSSEQIQVRNLTFKYPGFEESALNNLSFNVKKGEVFGIAGHLGAGKTTLCMSLVGFVPRLTGGDLRGNLQVANRDPRKVSGNEITSHVGMVFENFSAQMTQVYPLEEVMAPLVNNETPLSLAEKKARELLEKVELDHLIPYKKRTWELSGGQQQRLAIAAMLARDPEIIIFDDATGMLDPDGTESIKNIIKTLAGDHTLIVVDQSKFLAELTDRMILMRDGEILEKGPSNEVLRQHDKMLEAGVNPTMTSRVSNHLGLTPPPVTAKELETSLDKIDRIPNRSKRNGKPPDSKNHTSSSNRESAIVIEKLDFQYGDGTSAIKDVDLKTYRGEILGVAGGNGAGKTTLIKLLAGLINPTSGRIVVDGTDTRGVPASELAESIGTVFQNPDEQISEGTVEEEIRFPLVQRQHESTGWFSKSKRYDETFIKERVREARKLVQLPENLLQHDPSFLPRGQRKLVSLAEVLTLKPSVVLLDEPVVGMDLEARKKISSVLQRLKSENKSVVVVEHDMDFLSEHADRIAVLRQGQLSLVKEPAKLFTKPNWEQLEKNYLRAPEAAQLADTLGFNSISKSGLTNQLKKTSELR